MPIKIPKGIRPLSGSVAVSRYPRSNSRKYLLKKKDVNRLIRFEVTPIAQAGSKQGRTVKRAGLRVQ